MQSRIIMSNKIHGIISKYVIFLDNNYINAMLWMNKKITIRVCFFCVKKLCETNIEN
jgi:hypothetical protein